MAAITEDYVSFKIAKLLKEKGFKEITQGYITADKEIYMLNFQEGVYELGKNKYPYPTLQMAMKWLREVHKLEVRSTYDYDKDTWWGSINPMFEETDENSDIYQKALRFDYPGKSYEETCEAAIKYCLENLI